MWRYLGIALFSFCLLAEEGAPTSTSKQASAVPDETLVTNTIASREVSTNAVLTNAPYKIPENEIIQFYVPLTREGRLALAPKNQVVDYVKAAIAVPSGFNAEIPNPILLVSGTSDGDGSSVRWMPAYTNIALRLGWVVIAADGPYGKPLNETPSWRWALASSVLEHMHKSWPRSRRWPIAAVGVSGGGKWSGVLGAILANKGYNLIGVFMAGVNQDLASDSAKPYQPAIRYKSTPIYLSSGMDDKIATPQHHNEVKESLLNFGFSSVRLETFKGGHALSETELRKALSWFLEEYGKK